MRLFLVKIHCFKMCKSKANIEITRNYIRFISSFVLIRWDKIGQMDLYGGFDGYAIF
jgi:hypothetical protein